jgi:hypothetical protein
MRGLQGQGRSAGTFALAAESVGYGIICSLILVGALSGGGGDGP